MNGLVRVSWYKDVFGWLFVATLLAGGLVEIVVGQGAWLTLVALAILATVERKRMAAFGAPWPSTWWVLAFPVYLWKRLTTLGLSRHMFWLWLAVSLGLGVADIALDGAALEWEAQRQLTEHFKSMPKVTTWTGQEIDPSLIECVKVELGEELPTGGYLSKAYFNDGSARDILVQRKDGKVVVSF